MSTFATAAATNPAGDSFVLATQTAQGPWRQRNEDMCWADSQRGTAMIADGVGGLPYSAEGVQQIQDHFRRESIRSVLWTPSQLRELMQELNQILGRYGWGRARSGAAATLLQWKDTAGIFAHIGDTSLWLVNGHSCRRLTDSHRAYHSHWKTERLHNYLGQTPFPEIQTGSFTWSPHDSLLMATDGVTDICSADELHTLLLNRPQPEESLRQIFRLIEQRQGHDNATAILIRHLPMDPKGRTA